MTKHEFIAQFILAANFSSISYGPMDAQVKQAGELWDKLQEATKPTVLPLTWEEDHLGDTECAEKAVFGAFELSFDYDDATDSKKTPSIWRAGLYTAEDTELVMETKFEASDSIQAKQKTIEWARGIFGDALAALK